MVSTSKGRSCLRDAVVNITDWRGILDCTLVLGWFLCRVEMRKESPGAVRTLFIPCVRRLQELWRVFYDRAFAVPPRQPLGVWEEPCVLELV